MDMLVGALCCVGRGFACVRRVGRLDSARRARLGWSDLAVLGALGRVRRGFGSARRAGLGWA